MSRTGNTVGIVLIGLGLYCLANFGIHSTTTWFAGLVLVVFAAFWPD